MPQKEPETLEEAVARIAELTGELEDERREHDGTKAHMSGENEDLENEIFDLNKRLERLEGSPSLRSAAELVVAETARPVGDINAVTIADSPASRRALRALCDAAGRP